MTNREIFEENTVRINSTVKDLEKGYLVINNEEGTYIDLPKKIVDKSKFNELVFKAWNNVKIRGAVQSVDGVVSK